MEIIKNLKFKKVMTKLLEWNFEINEGQLELLLQHIIKLPENPKFENDLLETVISDDEDDEEDKENVFIFCWINQVLDIWEKTEKISPNGFWFILNLTTALSKDEHTFMQLNMQGILTRMLTISRVAISKYYYKKLSCCKLLSSFLNHKSGFNWIITNNSTEKIISLALNNTKTETFRECCEFIATVLERSVENNEKLFKNTMKKLTSPLFDHLINMPKNDFNEKNVIEQEIIYLNLLIGVLEESLELCCKNSNFKIFKMLERKFCFNKYLKNLKFSSKNENVSLEIDCLFFILIFSELGNFLCSPFLGIEERQEKKRNQYFEISNIMKERAKKEKLSNNVKLSHKALCYLQWIRQLTKNSSDEDTETLQLETQMIALQAGSLAMNIHIPLELNMDTLMAQDDMCGIILGKLMKNIPEFTMRLLLEMKQNKNVSLDDAIISLSYLLHSKKLYSRELVNYVIQLPLFLLGDIIYAIEHFPEKCANLTEEFISMLFDVIMEYVQEYNMTWPEGIKVLSLTEISYKFLRFQVNSPKLLTKGLQLLNIGISRNMSPSLVLLVDDSEKNLINKIAAMLLEKLLHQDVAVRKNALEVVYTIASNSKTKFPSFRNVLENYKFPYIVLSIATNEVDSSIKAAALRCLKQMLEVDKLRKSALAVANICDQLLQILYLDDDISVRIEAADVITEIYDLDTMEDISDNFCDIMSHVIFTNKEKKLKTKTLDFWHKVIDVVLRRQGIMDGQFPDATFSMQLKRIIHFDRQTIRNSIYSILNDLSQNGCLAIFIHVFREERDFDIYRATKACFEEIIALLKKYDITSSSTTSDYFSSPFDSLSPATNSSEELLNGTLSPVSFISEFESIDVQELGTLDNSMFSSYTVNSDCVLKCRQLATPNEFLNFFHNEFDTCFAEIQAKANSENDINTFLDQILSHTGTLSPSEK